MNGCEPPSRCLEVNPGLLQEQPALNWWAPAFSILNSM